MGQEYILIESADRPHTHDDSRIDVELSVPIENAINVRMASLTIACDFYNISADNNHLTFVMFTCGGPSVAAYGRHTVYIPPDFYTIPLLVEKVNEVLIDAVPDTADAANPGWLLNDTDDYAMLPDGRTEVKFVYDDETGTIELLIRHFGFDDAATLHGSGYQNNNPMYQRMVLYHPPHRNFNTSVAHHLGYARNQVASHLRSDMIFRDGAFSEGAISPNGQEYKAVPTKYIIWDVPLKKRLQVAVNESSTGILGYFVFTLGAEYTYTPDTFASTIVATPAGEDSAGNSLPSSVTVGYMPFEVDPFLYIKSDLVQHFQRTLVVNGVSHTQNDSILAKIHIDRNRGSWIHANDTQNAFVHQLDGRTIKNFTIELADVNGKNFLHDHYKDFSIILLFETHDDKLAVNTASIDAMRKQMFDKKYRKY